MAPPVALIKCFPVLGSIATTVNLIAVGVLGLALMAAAARLLLRWRRQAAITELGRQRGLGEQSAAFLGGLFAGEGMDAAETMLAAPDLLRARLARELRRRHRDESATAYAAKAAHLLEELNSIPPPFPGAPSPFMQLALQDAADPKGEVLTAWVLSIDERNITLISRHDCDWPMRRELLATPPDGHGEAFRASLLLRPVPPRHEWVLTHDMVDVITNRRAAVRVPCCLHTHVLPDNGDTVLLRERLADQEAVPADELRRLHGWAQRHVATVVDVSSDGCRVELEHEVALRDRFHVMFVGPDDRLAGLPLAEVVALQRSTAGRVAAGVRFIGMRLKERMRLAEFVRAVAASEGGAIATAVREQAAEEARQAAAEARAAEQHAAAASDDGGGTLAVGALPAALAETEPDPEPLVVELSAETTWREPRSPREPADAPDSTDAAADDDAADQDEPDLTIDPDEHRRAMERLRLGLESTLPGPSEADQPFDYTPRFTAPFSNPEDEARLWARREPGATPTDDERPNDAQPVDLDPGTGSGGDSFGDEGSESSDDASNGDEEAR